MNLTDLKVCQIIDIHNFWNTGMGFSYLSQAFELWKEVWSKTFEELNGYGLETADNFTRQDEIVGLWFKNECIALVCHRFVNISLKWNKMDSYFQSWPLECVQQIEELGTRLAIGSQITISPHYRKTALSSSWGAWNVKKMISYLSFHSLCEQKRSEVVCGTMRMDKGMAELFYNSGAQCLREELVMHGVPVAAILFDIRGQKRIPIPEDYRNLIKQLWDHRIQVSNSNSNLNGREIFDVA